MKLFSNKKDEIKNKSNKNDKTRRIQLKYLPLEKEEETNPEVALYNEIVRHAWTYSQEPFSHNVKSNRISTIFYYVLFDYPELFWVDNISYNNNEATLIFRCLDKNGNFDKKQVEQKREALRKASNEFTKGINKKTPPYEALITIYRRLILKLDYDGVRLKNDSVTCSDPTKDDVLRSLYSALVEHKVVCAGYAYAMQFLLQRVGISCGYVLSDVVSNSSHAFNGLKIGKYCYYLDATWGDNSNTLTGKENKYDIFYDYVCVPFKEFILTSKDRVGLHTPNSEFFPSNERFNCTTHEYFRQIGAYLKSYDEETMVKIFANAVNRYNEKEMGRFCVAFRCVDIKFRDYVLNRISNPKVFATITKKAIIKCGKNEKKAKKLFSCKIANIYAADYTPTAYLFFDNLN